MRTYICLKCERNCQLTYNDLNIEDHYPKTPFRCPMGITDPYNNDDDVARWNENDKQYMCDGCDIRCCLIVSDAQTMPFKCPYAKFAYIEDCDLSGWHR